MSDEIVVAGLVMGDLIDGVKGLCGVSKVIACESGEVGEGEFL